jgi:hypothetical protein
MEEADVVAKPTSGVACAAVSPLPGATAKHVHVIETPTLDPYVMHKDHSDSKDVLTEDPEPPAKKSKLFPETLFIIVPSSRRNCTSHVPIMNITLPLSKLINFINTSFKCCKCHNQNNKKIMVER